MLPHSQQLLYAINNHAKFYSDTQQLFLLIIRIQYMNALKKTHFLHYGQKIGTLMTK